MAGMVLQTNLQNSRIFDKSYLIEMNEAPGEFKNEFSFNADIHQPLTASPIQGRPPHQNSTASLESNVLIDQSEEQPLTRVHLCQYDECHKFRQEKSNVAEDPSSPLKNASLIVLVVLLTLWIIVYAVLTQLKVL